MERLAVGSAVIGLIFLISWPSAFAGGQQRFSIKVFTSPDDQFWTNSVIIEGEHEVMLVDAQLTKNSAEKVLQEINATKKPLSIIYITHEHADHFLGLEVFKVAYPGVRIIATSAVVDRINIVYQEKIGKWKKILGTGATSHAVAIEKFDGNFIEFESSKIEVLKNIQGDTDENTMLWIPGQGTLIAGDVLFNDMHVYTAETDSKARGKWLNSLQRIRELKPSVVIPGHSKVRAPPDASTALDFTENYLLVFEEELKKAKDADSLINTMREKFPSADLLLAIERGAKANVKPRQTLERITAGWMPMKKYKIAVLDDYQNVALESADWSVLRDRADIAVFHDHLADPDALIERLLPFDVICVMRERSPLPRNVIERLPNLKLIASTGSGNASIDVAAASKHGIAVVHTGYRSDPTIEFTWALILASARHMVTESNSVRSGGWQQTVGTDLRGKTLGVLGLGRIGSQVARIGSAFGMNLIAWSQNMTPEAAKAAGAILVSKDQLFERADILTIHLVLSSRTRGLVGAAELERMKPAARLINASRGPIVEEQALISVLKNKQIAGAAIDVFEIEPLPPDHPFRTLDNVLATPHIGYVSHGLYKTFYEDTVSNIHKWLDTHQYSARTGKNNA